MWSITAANGWQFTSQATSSTELPQHKHALLQSCHSKSTYSHIAVTAQARTPTELPQHKHALPQSCHSTNTHSCRVCCHSTNTTVVKLNIKSKFQIQDCQFIILRIFFLIFRILLLFYTFIIKTSFCAKF